MKTTEETEKATRLLGVGGAVCAPPEKCDCCERPATIFRGRPNADPWLNRVEGLCPQCDDHFAAVEDWRRANPSVSTELDEIEGDANYLDSAPNDLPFGGKKQAEAEAEALWAKARALKSDHGYPTRAKDHTTG